MIDLSVEEYRTMVKTIMVLRGLTVREANQLIRKSEAGSTRNEINRCWDEITSA